VSASRTHSRMLGSITTTSSAEQEQEQEQESEIRKTLEPCREPERRTTRGLKSESSGGLSVMAADRWTRVNGRAHEGWLGHWF
jgi:hypothetical protein